MKVAIIVFPGSNCDRDAFVALESILGSAPLLIWHKDTKIPDVDLVILPGGCSYGDYLRAGAMAANSPILNEVVHKAKKGIHILGICNGFQILTECELSPGALIRNSGISFICRDVDLRVENIESKFLHKYKSKQIIRIPIAHHDGNYIADEKTLNDLEENNLIALRYCSPSGEIDNNTNPNGSNRNIAGILNKNLNVLGMMPHPERLIDKKLGGVDGKALFEGLFEVMS